MNEYFFNRKCAVFDAISGFNVLVKLVVIVEWKVRYIDIFDASHVWKKVSVVHCFMSL